MCRRLFAEGSCGRLLLLLLGLLLLLLVALLFLRGRETVMRWLGLLGRGGGSGEGSKEEGG